MWAQLCRPMGSKHCTLSPEVFYIHDESCMQLQLHVPYNIIFSPALYPGLVPRLPPARAVQGEEPGNEASDHPLGPCTQSYHYS